MNLLSERDMVSESKGYWWKDRNFTHPETKNTVGFKSLPLAEQKRLNDLVRKNSPEKFKPEQSQPPEQEVKKKVVKKKVKPEQPMKEKVKPKQVKPEQKPKPVMDMSPVEPVKKEPVKKVPEKMSKDEWFDYKFGKLPKKVQKQITDGEKGFASVEEIRKQTDREHKENVQKAISKGVMDSHPDYPELQKEPEEKGKIDKILENVKQRLNPAQQHNLDKLLQKVKIKTKEKGVEDKEKAKRNKKKEFKEKHEKKLLGLLDRFKFDGKEKKIVKDIFSHIYSTNPDNALSLMHYLESLEGEDESSGRG